MAELPRQSDAERYRHALETIVAAESSRGQLDPYGIARVTLLPALDHSGGPPPRVYLLLLRARLREAIAAVGLNTLAELPELAELADDELEALASAVHEAGAPRWGSYWYE